jgi:predicted nucleic acid-binding protein
MSKKNFTGGLNSLLGETPEEPKKPGSRPKTAAKEITKTSQEGTKESETRATFIVNEEQLEKLKSIAYWDRLLIKDVVAQALEDYLTRYEKKNGAIKPAPAK